MAGFGAFGANGSGGAGFVAGGEVVPAAGSVLGADYDAGNYAVLPERCAGAVLGAIAASYFGSQMLVFGASVFILGLLSAIVYPDRSAYRFGGVTLAIVMLVPRSGPAWQVAFHRFAEVSIGIGVALILTVVWPEKEVTPPGKKWLLGRLILVATG
jgi:hypothetical protein